MADKGNWNLEIDECLSCKIRGSVLYEIPGHRTKKSFLCDPCYDAFVKGYYMIAYCESCHTEIIVEDTDISYLCKACEEYSAPIEIDRDEEREAVFKRMEEDYERGAYLNYSKPRVKKPMCVRRALRYFIDARKNEDKHIIRDRAFSYFRALKGLPADSICVAALTRLANQQGITPWTLMVTLAKYDRTDEGVDELVALSKEIGYKAYMALDEDNMTEALGFESSKHSSYAAYLADTNLSFCLEANDDDADVPF